MFRKKQIIEYRTVLFVDDEEATLRSIARELLYEPYNQIFANSGEEALEILQTEEVHVIVVDMRMPGMDGIELLKIVREKYPHIVKMVFSGNADMTALWKEFKQGEIFEIIQKPCKFEIEFKTVVIRALEHYTLRENVTQLNRMIRET